MAKKTISQLEKDINAMILFVLTNYEELAGAEPAVAADPYTFNERRRLVKRRLWDLHKEYVKSGAGQ
jgi:hypothetical protein